MLKLLQSFAKNLPTLLLSFVLSVAVWISAVSASDPTEVRSYPRQVPVELIGQDPSLVVISGADVKANLTFSAPHSIWDRLNRELSSVRAIADLSGLGPGTHTLPVQIQVSISPVRVLSFSPDSVTVVLDALSTRTFAIHFIQQGEPAVGFQAGNPELDASVATVSGPENLVNQVKEVRAVLSMDQATENIDRDIDLEAYDSNGRRIEGIAISPSQIHCNMSITQRGGYRNVVVKAILTGQVASGYRVTNISVFPPAITVYSSNPQLVEDLPGYIETEALDLSGVKDDLDVNLALNLPPGVSVIGDRTVEVQVGIAAIEGSVTLENMTVEFINLGEGLAAAASPAKVDVILSGPLPILDALSSNDVHIIIDLRGVGAGTYQRIPRAEITSVADRSLQVSILPGSIEVTISQLQSPTSTTAGPQPTAPVPTTAPTPGGG